MTTFTLNNQSITALDDETIIQAAQRHQIAIPHLCYKEGYRPDGNCRACMVEIDGERVLSPSCCRQPSAGMVVYSNNERALKSQKMVLELLLCDMPKQSSKPSHRYDSQLQKWCEHLNVRTTNLPRRSAITADVSHPAIAVNLDNCIACNLCIRACREEQCNDVIGMANSGQHVKIIFDLDVDLKHSTCVSCGECVQACPTEALTSALEDNNSPDLKEVDSVCPYCGVGCLLTYQVHDNKIKGVKGRNGPANKSRLCVKGRYGFDYVHHDGRLKQPLIRRNNAPKSIDKLSPKYLEQLFRPASWDEALKFATQGLKNTKAQQGKDSLAGFGSAKCSNEEAYLFQKLVRTGFENNNVDHCTRLCHASSVHALLEGIGSGAVSNPFNDVEFADVIIIIGANPAVNHPVAASFFKNAAKQGKVIIEMNPIRTSLSRLTKHFVQFHPGTDVLLLNAMMHTIIKEELFDQAYIDKHTKGFEAIKSTTAQYPPEAVSGACGVSVALIKTISRLYAQADNAIIFWGMGISQHVHGTDNARCLIALSLMCAQIGRRGTGLHPLRGQNNVQGASDAGLIPMMLPDYQLVNDADVHAKFSRLWGVELDKRPGKTVTEVIDGIMAGDLSAMYIMGENPAMSDPNLNHSRQAIAKLKHLIVQDIFYTETAALADVILPATTFVEKNGTVTNTNRQVQMGRKALDAPGLAKPDWWITTQIANGLGLNWHYDNVEKIFNEMRQTMPNISGITWEQLEQQSSVTYPYRQESNLSEPVIFKRNFPTKDGKALFVPAKFKLNSELPDKNYPLVLITGRILEHWHTGSMSRKSRVLNALKPQSFLTMNPKDAKKLGIKSGAEITLKSKRGKVQTFAKLDSDLQVGNVFMPFCFVEAAANIITRDDIDPSGKIPAFKYCAVAVNPCAKTA